MQVNKHVDEMRPCTTFILQCEHDVSVAWSRTSPMRQVAVTLSR